MMELNRFLIGVLIGLIDRQGMNFSFLVFFRGFALD
jgi:hypothetical protein